MLVENDFAQYIHDTMNFNVFTMTVSDHLRAWAGGVIDEITTNATVAHASGNVLGASGQPNPAPLLNGAAVNGMISGMSGNSMANFVIARLPFYSPAHPYLIAVCTAIVNHIQNIGRVVFEPGEVIGTCGNFIAGPAGPQDGPFNGSASGGEITLLDFATLASDIDAVINVYGVSLPFKLEQFCQAVTQYIMDNAEVDFASITGIAQASTGSIVGTVSASGGLIT